MPGGVRIGSSPTTFDGAKPCCRPEDISVLHSNGDKKSGTKKIGGDDAPTSVNNVTGKLGLIGWYLGNRTAGSTLGTQGGAAA